MNAFRFIFDDSNDEGFEELVEETEAANLEEDEDEEILKVDEEDDVIWEETEE
jgi:hypothetical protein